MHIYNTHDMHSTEDQQNCVVLFLALVHNHEHHTHMANT